MRQAIRMAGLAVLLACILHRLLAMWQQLPMMEGLLTDCGHIET